MTPRTDPDTPGSGAELARAWFDHSPFVQRLGMSLELMEPEHSIVLMPYDDGIATAGDLIHGGATSSLIDTAATMSAWSNHEPGPDPKWGTVGMSLNFLAPAAGSDLRADARVSRRAKTMCFCRVAVRDGADRLIAEALVIYRLV
jgi:uncharacterized protein (TIGR00369 family)